MALIKFTNFGTSTIANAGGILAGDLSLDVAAGEGALFPALGAGEYFYCVLVDGAGNREVIKVTARAVDTFTITRAQDGTAARAFALGDLVELRLNKGAMDDIITYIEGIPTDTDFTKDEDAMTSDSATHLATQQSIKAYVDVTLGAPATTDIIGFCQNAAPTGWTRKTDRQDNAMICLAATGNPAAAGGVNPQSTHTHTGPSHTHAGGTLAFRLAQDAAVGSRAVGNAVGTFGAVNPQLAADGGGGAVDRYTAHVVTDGSTTSGASAAGGTGATGANTAPYSQEVIEATKD